MDENNQNQLNIELGEEQAEGIYSNLAIISHSNAEFVMDFIRVMPGIPKARVKARIVMTPQHAKRLVLALQDNIRKFEATFGVVELKDNNPPHFPGGFGGPAGVA